MVGQSIQSMKQQVMVGPGQSTLEVVPLPQPGEGQLLVKIKYCGVCRSEYDAWRSAQAGRRFGHETMGHVVALGPGVEGFEIGDRVSGLVHPALAEYALYPAHHTCKVPDEIPDIDAILEPISCLVSAVSKLPLPILGDATAVVGCGYMGLGAISLLRLKGAGNIIAIDTRREALEDALRLGASEAYLPGDIPGEYFSVWENGCQGGLPLVSEWGGNNATLDLAGRLCAVGGSLGIGAYHSGERRLVDMQLWNYKAIQVLMAHERDMDHLFRCGKQGFDLMARGLWPFMGLSSKVYALDQFDLAMEESASKPGKFIKGIIDCTKLSNQK